MQRLAVGILVVLASIPTAFAICNNCEPNPTSSTYQSTIKQRPLSWNWRDRDLDGGGGWHGTAPTKPLPTFGSSSYNYSIPILHQPGRNGLDLDLTLRYNSRI